MRECVGSATSLGVFGLAILVSCVLWSIQVRLSTRHANVRPYDLPNRDELLRKSRWTHIDTLKGVPVRTGAAYIVIGGAGDAGSDLVRLLRKRGETRIRVIDISRPPIDVLDDIEWIKCDVTNCGELQRAVHKSFDGDGHMATVVHYTAASIRFYETAQICLPLSQAVNLYGVRNAMDALGSLPGNDKLFLYTSSIATRLPRKSFLPLGPYPKTEVRSDEEPLLPERDYVQACYQKSKRQGEASVIAADGKNGLRTGTLNVGMGIIGPRGVFVASYLRLPFNPCWGAEHAQTAISSVDVARAMLIYEQGLRTRPDECAGEAFAVTGDRQAWRFGDVWYATELFAGRKLHFISMPTLLMFGLSHLNMLFIHMQYHLLRWLGLKASFTPSWMGIGVMLQPGIFETATRDVIVDDTRFRCLFDYEPVYSTAQAIRLVVDQFEHSRAASVTGPLLQLPRSGLVKRSPES